MPLITNHLEPWHWAIAGAAIAAITLSLLWLTNRRLGISTGFENLCALAVSRPYFRRSELTRSHGWRLPFLAGLVLSGFLSSVAGGGWSPTWDMGMLDSTFHPGVLGKIGWTLAGGFLIGVGTRMAGGCTSGHGIFGLSNLEPASLVATISFLGAGMATSFLVYGVLA